MKNHQNIKVSEALKKGNRWINIPAILLLVFFLFIAMPTLMYFFRNDKSSVILVVSGILCVVLGIVSPILWWSINIVKYKIWVAKNVKDIHRFYEEAQTKKLIDDRKFFRKLEIKSKNQKKELLKFYERLNSDRILVRDIDNSIEKETVFKSGLKWGSYILFTLVIVILYFYSIGKFNFKQAVLYASLLLIFGIIDLYKSQKHNYILKINRDSISYKDEEIIINWEEVDSYQTIVATNNTAKSKLVIYTKNKDYELILDGYQKIKMNKVLNVLNENKHRFEINQSMR